MSQPAFVTALLATVWTVNDLPNQLGHWKPSGISASQWTDSSGHGRHFVQATTANQPIVTTSGGVTALQTGAISGTSRYMTAPVNTGNVQSLSDYLICESLVADTNDRTLVAYNATSEIRVMGYGTDNHNGGITVAVPAPPEPRVEPAMTFEGPLVLSFIGDAVNRNLYLDGYDTFPIGNPSTSSALAVFTLGNSNTPTLAKAFLGKICYRITCSDTHSVVVQKEVVADIFNDLGGMQVLWQGNSQGTYVHKTSTGEEQVRQIKPYVPFLMMSTNYSVGGKTTPQMVADFDSQVYPLINYSFRRRVYIGQEGENDLFINGRNDSNPNDVTYATTTAVQNYKNLFTKAIRTSAGFRILMGTPPTTAGVVGGGGPADTPLNYEASRLALDAYWRANAWLVYNVWNDTWYQNTSPALDPVSGQPYVHIFVDAFNLLSPMGTIASLTESGYYQVDRQHVNVLGGYLWGMWVGKALIKAKSLMMLS